MGENDARAMADLSRHLFPFSRTTSCRRSSRDDQAALQSRTGAPGALVLVVNGRWCCSWWPTC